MKKLLLTLAAVASFGIITGQQTIGEFPIMDGGFENQSAGNMSSAGSNQVDTPQTEWTVSSTGNSLVREITDDAVTARTGTFSATFQLTTTATNVRLQSPSTVMPNAMAVDTEYTIQFFYNAAVDPGDDLDPGIYLNNTTSGSAGNKTDDPAFVANSYTKTYETRTTNSIFNASNWAVARMSGSNQTQVTIDDFVVYAGAYDDIAPDAPTSASGTYATDGTVAWDAASGGVDGGGYLVVKYPSTAAADTDINQNGIYSVGNTTTAGGDVVYIGTGTTFADTYTSGAEYKVFTADKAFNYSAGLTLVEETLSLGDLTINGSQLAAFPVPMTETLMVSEDVDSAKLYALNGAVVASSSTNAIDVASLAKGAYILEIEIDGKTASKMVVK